MMVKPSNRCDRLESTHLHFKRGRQGYVTKSNLISQLLTKQQYGRHHYTCWYRTYGSFWYYFQLDCKSRSYLYILFWFYTSRRILKIEKTTIYKIMCYIAEAQV